MRASVRSMLGAVAVSATALHAQTPAAPFGDGFLDRVRRESMSLPGPMPTSINALVVADFAVRLSSFVEGGLDSLVQVVIPIFQIRYPESWVIVDAAGDSASLGLRSFFRPAWDSTRAALLGAKLIVLTHEHHDHVAGLIVTPDSVEVAKMVLLAKDQLETLQSTPNRPSLRLDSARAVRFQTVAYDDLRAIGPGIVLIKARGHTPGSQMVYIRTSSGSEVILAGDVAWNSRGIDEGRQKPAAASANLRNLGVAEDRERIAPQLAWLRTVRASGVHVVVSHDKALMDDLVARGILRYGLVVPPRSE